MPRKIRELIKDLKMAGFVHRSGVIVTLSGKPGDDAKRYQERTVLEKIKESRG